MGLCTDALEWGGAIHEESAHNRFRGIGKAASTPVSGFHLTSHMPVRTDRWTENTGVGAGLGSSRSRGSDGEVAGNKVFGVVAGWTKLWHFFGAAVLCARAAGTEAAPARGIDGGGRLS